MLAWLASLFSGGCVAFPMGKGHVSRAQAVVVSILQCYACFESLSCFPNEYVIARLLGAGSTDLRCGLIFGYFLGWRSQQGACFLSAICTSIALRCFKQWD
ncbi:conserved hypothetical protein [Xylella fastidiosa M12]|nr:conserved hypothetical protein [Xylella fastidiosa M12]